MALTLGLVMGTLDSLAPLHLAASWDNVGLIIEPAPEIDREIGRVLVTIDLSEDVLDEALQTRSELVVAYHPPIFQPLKRLTRANADARVVLRAIANGIAVYSPHTALDAVAGGVNDWLLEAFGDSVRDPRAIEPAPHDSATELTRPVGAGRLAKLDPPIAIDAAAASVKRHLGLDHVRLAMAANHANGAPVRSVAVCPGAGGSLFAGLGSVDLLLTGELRHHDIRARNAAGTSVILGDHTNTERGYLPCFAARLYQELGGAVEVIQSARDRDPLRVI
ncbi:MAG: Nif3-like dinuclear metal center hexameric protein [Polyangiaceae bacterium]|nr:Nif3-like dinuclear metal center hexameric protein [Polyangiaceae bacterium]